MPPFAVFLMKLLSFETIFAFCGLGMQKTSSVFLHGPTEGKNVKKPPAQMRRGRSQVRKENGLWEEERT
jgi:hypothetical protein